MSFRHILNMEPGRRVGQLYRSGALAGKAKLAHRFHPLHALRHFTQLIRRTVPQPQTVARATVDKLLGAVPGLEPLCRRWFNFQKFVHFLFGEKIVAAVNRFVANPDFWYITKRLTAALHKHIVSVQQIPVDVLNHLRPL